MLNARDEHMLRLSFRFAEKARAAGNHPFGALLVTPDGEVLLASENSVVTQGSATAHAELNLMQAATRGWEPALLKTCTVYTSGEPCPMCAGAIVWGNVRRVVFGLGLDGIYAAISAGGIDPDAPGLALPSREVFASAPWPVTVIGPALEDEAREVHAGFW